MGNVLGYIGNGKHLIAIDGYLDVGGIGAIDQWNYDPCKGFEDE